MYVTTSGRYGSFETEAQAVAAGYKALGITATPTIMELTEAYATDCAHGRDCRKSHAELLAAVRSVEPAWVPVTEALLNSQEPWLYEPMWIALKGGRVVVGRYEWRQGRNPDRFYSDGSGDHWAYEASHVAKFSVPKSPEHAASVPVAA